MSYYGRPRIYEDSGIFVDRILVENILQVMSLENALPSRKLTILHIA